jgi:hypothetical protein
MGPEGSAPAILSDAADDAPLACGVGFCGVVYDGSVGSVAYPPDSSLPDAGDQEEGDVTLVMGVVDASPVDAFAADAADDATAPCHPCGVVIRPDG